MWDTSLNIFLFVCFELSILFLLCAIVVFVSVVRVYKLNLCMFYYIYFNCLIDSYVLNYKLVNHLYGLLTACFVVFNVKIDVTLLPFSMCPGKVLVFFKSS